MRGIVAVVVVIGLLVGTPVGIGAQSNGDGCSFPVTRTDATGTDVQIPAEPQTVVTLNPSAAQTMWELGAKDKVIGVTSFAAYLEGASEKENVSTAGGAVSNEKVVALAPDLVLAPNTITAERIETLRNAGLTVFRFGAASSIADIEAKTRLIGRLTGECAGADETVAWMEGVLEDVDARVEDRPRPDAIYVFFNFTAGQNTFAHDVIERAGASNIAADVGIDGFQRLNLEVLVQHDPDWILLNSDWDELPGHPVYQNTTAATKDQTVVVDTNRISQPAPRVVLPVRRLARAMHPGPEVEVPEEVVENSTVPAEATETHTPTPMATRTATPTVTSTATPTDATPQPSQTVSPVPTETRMTPSPTASSTPTATIAVTRIEATPQESSPATATGGTGDGVGVLGGLGALVGTLLLWLRRRSG